ncbi:PIN domain-containing protein [Bacillus bombysepticus]
MSYLIVLDTNVIFNDFFFKSADMKKLLKFTKNSPVDLCITEFNYHEILKKFKDEIRPLIKKVRSTKSDLIRLEAPEIIDFGNLKADKFVEKYQVTLNKIIQENNIEIIDFPKSADVVEKIALKYFNNKKPFDENKVSFQDAIIWESIVEYCQDNQPDQVAFISNNHKDFANREKNAIHEELAEDIENLSYYHSLSAFLEKEEENLNKYFIPDYWESEDQLNKLEAELRNFLDVNDYLENTMNDLLMNNTFEGQYIFGGWGTDGYIESIDIEINEVSLDIEDKTLLISFDVEMDVSFNIETIDPSHDYGDPGDGMMSERSRTKIWIRSNVTYILENEDLIDYVQLDRSLIS